MTYLRHTPAMEDISQDEAETFQKIADTFATKGQIMRARMFVCGQMAAQRRGRNGETPSRPKAANALV